MAHSAGLRAGYVTGHEFGRASLLSISNRRDAKVSVQLVVGLPDHYRERTVGYASVSDVAARCGAQYVEAEDGSLTDIIDSIRAAALDVLFVVGWSRLVSPDVLDLFDAPGTSDGAWCIGMHPTLLPRGRGRAPIPWTILKGLRWTGLSAFCLSPQADEGLLLAQIAVPVSPDATSASLFREFVRYHALLTDLLVDRLLTRTLVAVPQKGIPSVWPRRMPADSQIHDGASLQAIDRLIRACTPPYPPAFYVDRGGTRHTIVGAISAANKRPGAQRADPLLLPKSNVILVSS